MSLRGFLLVLIHLTVKPLALTGVLSKHLDRGCGEFVVPDDFDALLP